MRWVDVGEREGEAGGGERGERGSEETALEQGPEVGIKDKGQDGVQKEVAEELQRRATRTKGREGTAQLIWIMTGPSQRATNQTSGPIHPSQRQQKQRW